MSATVTTAATSPAEAGTPGETSPHSAPPPAAGLGAELRESLLLLAFAVGVTVGLTTAAQAALALLA